MFSHSSKFLVDRSQVEVVAAADASRFSEDIEGISVY